MQTLLLIYPEVAPHSIAHTLISSVSYAATAMLLLAVPVKTKPVSRALFQHNESKGRTCTNSRLI